MDMSKALNMDDLAKVVGGAGGSNKDKDTDPMEIRLSLIDLSKDPGNSIKAQEDWIQAYMKQYDVGPHAAEEALDTLRLEIKKK